MSQQPFYLRGVIEGRNSVLFGTGDEAVLYEKLANTIHSGDLGTLNDLQQKAESIDYRPTFEAESLRKRRDDPLGILLLEVTEQCNLECSYCIYSGSYVNERTATSKVMPFSIARRAIDELVPLSKGNVLIGFYGGEPLLNMSLVRQVMDYSRSSFPTADFTFSMTTNFFNAESHIPEIVDNGMYVNVSLDGPAEVHDKFRRTRGDQPTHDRILSNLRKVEEYSPGYVSSHVLIISTCHDPTDLEKIVQFFDANDLFVTRIGATESKGIIPGTELPSGKYNNHHLVRDYQQKILRGEDPRTLRRLFDQNLKTVALRDKTGMPEQLMLNGSCYPGKRRLFIDANGAYHPCERFGSRLSIGSVDEGLRPDLMEAAIDTLTKIRNNLCGNCWAQRLCAPCLQHAKDPEGDISLEGLSQTCETKKRQLAIGLYNYVTLNRQDKERTRDYVKKINPLFERG